MVADFTIVGTVTNWQRSSNKEVQLLITTNRPGLPIEDTVQTWCVCVDSHVDRGTEFAYLVGSVVMFKGYLDIRKLRFSSYSIDAVVLCATTIKSMAGQVLKG